MSVAVHLAMESSADLFQEAIIESGIAEGYPLLVVGIIKFIYIITFTEFFILFRKQKLLEIYLLILLDVVVLIVMKF